MKTLRVLLAISVLFLAASLFAQEAGQTGGNEANEEINALFANIDENGNPDLGVDEDASWYGYCHRWEAQAKSRYGNCWGRSWGQPSRDRAIYMAVRECEMRGCGPCMHRSRCQH